MKPSCIVSPSSKPSPLSLHLCHLNFWDGSFHRIAYVCPAVLACAFHFVTFFFPVTHFISIIASLDSPYILTCLGVSLKDIALVVEFSPHGDLTKLIAELDGEISFFLFQKVCGTFPLPFSCNMVFPPLPLPAFISLVSSSSALHPLFLDSRLKDRGQGGGVSRFFVFVHPDF